MEAINTRRDTGHVVPSLSKGGKQRRARGNHLAKRSRPQVQEQVDTERVQLGQERDKVLETSPEPGQPTMP